MYAPMGDGHPWIWLVHKFTDYFTCSSEEKSHVLLVEPFYGGSHQQLIDLLMSKIPGCTKVCMTAKKWHWRMRTSALHFATAVPLNHEFKWVNKLLHVKEGGIGALEYQNTVFWKCCNIVSLTQVRGYFEYHLNFATVPE